MVLRKDTLCPSILLTQALVVPKREAKEPTGRHAHIRKDMVSFVMCFVDLSLQIFVKVSFFVEDLCD